MADNNLTLIGFYQTKRHLCTRLIVALQTANTLTVLQNTAGVIRHLTYAIENCGSAIARLQMGLSLGTQGEQMIKFGIDQYMIQAKTLWARKPTNADESDVTSVRRLHESMTTRPGDFSAQQIDQILTLINWYDDQLAPGGFAYGTQVTLNSAVVDQVGLIVGQKATKPKD